MSETLPPSIRTGGDGPRGPEQYGYPVRMAAGFVPPRGEPESAADYIRPIGTAPDDRPRCEPGPSSWRVALGVVVLMLALFWLLTACNAVQTVAAYDMRPFPVPFNS